MIEQDDVLRFLAEACPSFSGAAAEHLAEHGNDVLYAAAGAFSLHLLAMHEQGNLAALQEAGVAIERLQMEGSAWVKEFATVGLLEGVQNVWSNNQVDAEQFRKYLGPESSAHWDSLNRFWSGAASGVKGEA